MTSDGVAVGRPARPVPLAAELAGELGMPFLPTVFTLLADHESYLQSVLEAFLARLPGGVDEHARATRLIGARAAAALVEVPLPAGSEYQPIMELIDAYNQANPRSLLFTVFVARRASSPWRVMEPPLPAHAPGDDLLADIKACHGGFMVPGFWRELAERWPGLAARAWSLVAPLAAGGPFAAARDEVHALAREAVVGSAATPEELGRTQTEANEIARIVSFYEIVIPTMVIEIECVRRALDLGAAVRA